MARRDSPGSDFRFEILEHVGVINTNSTGWSKELNVVSWNDKPAKYDIRDWHPDHGKMGRGITLTGEELEKLGILIHERSLRDGSDPAMFDGSSPTNLFQ